MNSERKTGWGASLTAPGADRLVSKREAAGILGVSVRTVERLVSAGSLQIQKVRGCARAFLTWLVKSGRLPANPLASVEKVETRGREVRNRRSLNHDEFLRLLAVAGPVRRVVYAVPITLNCGGPNWPRCAGGIFASPVKVPR